MFDIYNYIPIIYEYHKHIVWKFTLDYLLRNIYFLVGSNELMVLLNSWNIINNDPHKVFSYFSLSTVFRSTHVVLCICSL